MAALFLAKKFLTDYGNLPKKLQRSVDQKVQQFRELDTAGLGKSKGIHLERYKGQRDPRSRTIRIDENHRGIVLALEEKDTYVLIRVLTHKEADQWMVRNTFKANAHHGALEIIQVSVIEEQLEQVAAPVSEGLFDGRKDKDFIKFGIGSEFIPLIRSVDTEEAYDAMLGLFPENQAFALSYLVNPETSLEEIDRELSTLLPSAGPELDTEDLAAATAREVSKGEFVEVKTDEDYAWMRSQPFAHWRIFLHPSQYKLVEKDWNGPAKVAGLAGTGKTVVALHRAKYLADQIEDSTGKPILFTTFTGNLAQAIEGELRQLGGQDLLDNVEVATLGQIANREVQNLYQSKTNSISDQEALKLWKDVHSELGITDHTPEFLMQEWVRVVLGQDVHSQREYLRVPRTGRGIPLNRAKRAEVWAAVEEFQSRLKNDKRLTFTQQAGVAAANLKQSKTKRYRHVIVDEMQDLHEAHWRMIAALVPNEPSTDTDISNNIFVVGDSHQRIFGNQTSFKSLGINVVGRSRKLRINYRTTHQILQWSLKVLGDGKYLDIDDTVADSEGQYSLVFGEEPQVVGAASAGEHLDHVIDRVKKWIDGGLKDSEIGVTARTNEQVTRVSSRLKEAGVKTLVLNRNNHPNDDMPGVRLGSMHRMKGLEFRAVVISGADDEALPLRSVITPKALDAVQHEQDLQTERSLLYVSCTRARDYLWVGYSGTPSRFLP